MEQQNNLDRLARYLIIIGALAIASVLCWYFSNVLIYIILAFVVSLVSHPLMRAMLKIRIKGKSAPAWLLAILSIAIVIVGLSLLFVLVIPVVINIINEASIFSGSSSLGDLSDTINGWIIGLFPSLGNL